MSEEVAALRKAAIARQFGVDRGYVTQLSRDGSWPEPVAPGFWSLEDVRRFLRQRARRSRPTATYCSACGGQLH